jgi:hypothetical protein
MCRSDADMLAGATASHAANAIFPDDETLSRQKRGLKAIFTRFLTAANTYPSKLENRLFFVIFNDVS